MNPAWIAVDWGTSNLRTWAVDAGHRVAARAESDRGAKFLARDEFEGALLALISDWLPKSGSLPVLVGGMAGSRRGWAEAPYIETPCDLGELFRRRVSVPTTDPRMNVEIVPGLCQRVAGRPDVMRGEEVQLLGFAAAEPGFIGLACLPGTHSKWVELDRGRVSGFTTYLSGELFEVLAEYSMLAQAMEGGGWDEAGFAAGVRAGTAAPGRLLALLFGVRAAALLENRNPAWCRSYLSGLTTGAELAAAVEGAATDIPVALIGAPSLTRLYEQALTLGGRTCRVMSGEAATLAGLAALHDDNTPLGKTGTDRP